MSINDFNNISSEVALGQIIIETLSRMADVSHERSQRALNFAEVELFGSSMLGYLRLSG